MNLLILIAFTGLITGGFVIFRISPFDFLEQITSSFKKHDNSIKTRIREVVYKKKSKGFKLLIEETKEVLKITNKSNKFSFLCVLSLLFMVAGVFVAVILSNSLLIPVLSVGFGLLSFWYILFTSNFYKKHISNELETALSVITASYLRTENIIAAVDENLYYLNPPIIDVFKGFVNQTRLINSNIKSGIESLKLKIDNNIFREWCDALIACQDDKNLKSTLLPIVSKLSDIKTVSSELDYLLYEPIKEYITMAILVVSNIPLLYLLNRNWFNTLFFHPAGKLVLAITGAVMFVSLAAVIKLSKPIEYKR